MAEVAKLLIYPENSRLSPDHEQVRDLLLECGLLGDAFEFAGEQRYFAGPGFFSLVTFMGCSPAVEFEPADKSVPDVSSFCHIRLVETGSGFAQTGPDTVNARCRSCGQALAEQQAALKDWQQSYVCPGCGNETGLDKLNWRRSAAFGRYFIEIWSIYPKEAIPVDSLLTRLEVLTACTWNYAYVREAAPEAGQFLAQ